MAEIAHFDGPTPTHYRQEIAALRARVAELEADAARYQFIKANVRRLDINGLCLSIQNLEARIDQMRDVPSAPTAHPGIEISKETITKPAQCVQCEGHGRIYGANSGRYYVCDVCSGTGTRTVIRQGTGDK